MTITSSNLEVIEQAFTCTPSPIIILDEDLNVAEINPAGLALFKSDLEKVRGNHFSDYFDSFSFNNAMGLFLKSNELETTLFHSFIIDRQTYNYKFILKKLSIEKSIVIFGEDQTKLVEKNEIIETYKKKNSKISKLALLGEMISGLSFELESPATIIKSTLSKLKRVIKESNLDKDSLDELINKINNIDNHTNRIVNLIKSIEDFSKDQLNAPMESILVRDLINNGLELCHERLKQNEIHLIVDEIDPDLKIDCKKNQIVQIILNLLENSKESLRGSDEKWIKVTAMDVGDHVRFKFIDSSPLPDANLIKEKFEEENINSDEYMIASKEIVQEHFGKIYFEAKENTTCFTFDIPKAFE